MLHASLAWGFFLSWQLSAISRQQPPDLPELNAGR
jgi:hypothetical protein